MRDKEYGVYFERSHGVPEVVDHEINGYLVDRNDVEGWPDCVNKLVLNESLRSRFGEAGRRKVLKNFTLEHITSKIDSIYTELTNAS